MSTNTGKRRSNTDTAPTAPPTRQLLDDLDALMKRMLELPVNHLEEESDDLSGVSSASCNVTSDDPSAIAINKPDTKSAEIQTDLTARATSLPNYTDMLGEIPPAPTLWLPETRILHSEPQPPAAEPGLQGKTMPASPEVLEAIGQVQTRVETHLPYEVQEVQSKTRTGGKTSAWNALEIDQSPGLRLLLRINQAFDWCVGRLGKPGRWLQSEGSKNLLGWIGLGLILGALGRLVLQEIGWTW